MPPEKVEVAVEEETRSAPEKVEVPVEVAVSCPRFNCPWMVVLENMDEEEA